MPNILDGRAGNAGMVKTAARKSRSQGGPWNRHEPCRNCRSWSRRSRLTPTIRDGTSSTTRTSRRIGSSRCTRCITPCSSGSRPIRCAPVGTDGSRRARSCSATTPTPSTTAPSSTRRARIASGATSRTPATRRSPPNAARPAARCRRSSVPRSTTTSSTSMRPATTSCSSCPRVIPMPGPATRWCSIPRSVRSRPATTSSGSAAPRSTPTFTFR